MLTDAQKKFIDLSKKIEKLNEEYKSLNSELSTVMGELGVGTHFQDPEDKTVFKIIVPKGRFVDYKPLAYERTKRQGEFKGTLSAKKAKELGYTL